ncbi:MAG: [protein-PII] uridylyltransferase [Proteobacteria bacterium]|nr:[protein-PII] uridylyltransferase [Pseudomonadota bacterium]
MSTLLVTLNLPNQLPENTKALAEEINQHFKQATQALDVLFWQGQSITDILYTRSKWCDVILSLAWNHFLLENEQVQLIAVGGYGFQRLHPYSDADILILVEPENNLKLNAKIEKFIAFCWDCNIKLGPSVRTFKECIELSSQDHTIYTNLLSSRLLIGNQHQFLAFTKELQSNQLWNFNDYFKTKYAQRALRHERYANSVYHLEPHLKDSPGGLRDIDFITWMVNKKYHSTKLQPKEYETLSKAQMYLWHLRYALHLIAQTPTERLYFEHQITLTKKFEIQESNINKAVSKFMRPYYQAAYSVNKITNLFCQEINEKIEDVFHEPKETLTSFCEIRKKYLHITNKQLSENDFINLFFLFAKHQLRAFTVSSIRLIEDILEQQPSHYFTNPVSEKIFLKLFTLDHHVSKTLTLMHDMGVLIHYIPEFELISGQMQYDLTHLYTVDAHTLTLIHTLETFKAKDQFDKFDFFNDCKQRIGDFSILYFCGLFHDIGKGQGEDHSHRGYQIVANFCQKNQIPKQNAEVICWLVKNHLLMSITSQRKDITDEQVIINFAKEVNSQEKLSYLYLFTVADMLATNPSLWNDWRGSLLQELYVHTTHYLQHNTLFSQASFTMPQTTSTLSHQKIVNITLSAHANLRGINLTVYAPDKPNLFAAICACLEKCYLTIVQARISHTPTDYSLQQFVALEIGDTLVEASRLKNIENQLNQLLKPIEEGKDCTIPVVTRHTPRALHFDFETTLNISFIKESNRTLIEVIAPDFPGLLARIGEVFIQANIRVHSAIINTLGKQVEDTFYILDKHTFQAPTDEARLTELCTQIRAVIQRYCIK